MELSQEGVLRPKIPFLAITGMILLTWSLSVYSAYGISAFPRQEWLIEVLAALLFLIPVVRMLRGPASLSSAIRFLGAMMILHSVWDALHWPGYIVIDTPIEPWIPKICPILNIPVGFLLLIRGR